MPVLRLFGLLLQICNHRLVLQLRQQQAVPRLSIPFSDAGAEYPSIRLLQLPDSGLNVRHAIYDALQGVPLSIHQANALVQTPLRSLNLLQLSIDVPLELCSTVPRGKRFKVRFSLNQPNVLQIAHCPIPHPGGVPSILRLRSRLLLDCPFCLCEQTDGGIPPLLWNECGGRQHHSPLSSCNLRHPRLLVSIHIVQTPFLPGFRFLLLLLRLPAILVLPVQTVNVLEPILQLLYVALKPMALHRKRLGVLVLSEVVGNGVASFSERLELVFRHPHLLWGLSRSVAGIPVMEQDYVPDSSRGYGLEVEVRPELMAIVPDILFCPLHPLLEVVDKPSDLYGGILAHRQHLLHLHQLVAHVLHVALHPLSGENQGMHPLLVQGSEWVVVAIVEGLLVRNLWLRPLLTSNELLTPFSYVLTNYVQNPIVQILAILLHPSWSIGLF